MGVDTEKVVQAKDVLKDKVIPGQHVVVIGGSLVGIEAAIFLVDKSCNVTVLEEKNSIMQGDLARFIYFLYAKASPKEYQCPSTTTIEEIAGDVIMTVNKSGVRNEFFADTIVNATGYISNEELVNELKKEY